MVNVGTTDIASQTNPPPSLLNSLKQIRMQHPKIRAWHFYERKCITSENATKCCSVIGFTWNWWHKNLDFKHVTRNTTYTSMYFKSMPIWECIFQYDIIKPRQKYYHPEILIWKFLKRKFEKFRNLFLKKIINTVFVWSNVVWISFWLSKTRMWRLQALRYSLYLTYFTDFEVT